jgi:hypothetical protein
MARLYNALENPKGRLWVVVSTDRRNTLAEAFGRFVQCGGVPGRGQDDRGRKRPEAAGSGVQETE